MPFFLRSMIERGASRRLYVDVLEGRQMLSVAPQLLKDINIGGSSGVTQFVAVGGTAFFAANDGMNGTELWKSDGTPAGTVLVKDIFPGASSSSPRRLMNVSGTLFFQANDGATGFELWKSDGTSAGTMLVKDIMLGSGGSDPRYLTNLNGMLFFRANDGSSGNELWKSDGMSAGTVLVRDINAGSASSGPNGLTNVNGMLFFRANDGTSGDELWISDGSSGGTGLVEDVNPGSGASSPNLLTNVNGTLFFSANDGSNGFELWKSDGTIPGTTLVKDIRPGIYGSNPDQLLPIGGTLYLSANDGSNGYELWKSDGMDSGTVLIQDLNPGIASFYPVGLTNLNGTLYFAGNDGTTGFELWKSDGISTGTTLIKDIRPGAYGSYPYSSYPEGLSNLNGTLLFSANDGSSSYELWKSDGTSGGTVLVSDIRPGVLGSYPSLLTNVNGTLFFTADDGIAGIEPWVIKPSSVVGRFLFYNQSSGFDGNNAAINSSDDNAIATDKTAYLPGAGVAAFSNVSSYNKGINGIMIDLAGGGTHTSINLSTIANDFIFKVGNNNTPSSWASAPTPTAVSVRAGAGVSGSDRVEITWATGAIANKWLEVQVLATTNTGLASTDVFCWGNKIGDIGSPTASSFTTTAAGDANPIIAGGLGPAGGITNVRDIDRSNTITAAGDRAAAIANIGAITRINIGTGGPFAPDGDGESAPAGDPGIASALASPVQTVAGRTPPVSVNHRLDSTDSGRRQVAVYFEQLAIASALALDSLDDDLDDLEELLDSLATLPARR